MGQQAAAAIAQLVANGLNLALLNFLAFGFGVEVEGYCGRASQNNQVTNFTVPRIVALQPSINVPPFKILGPGDATFVMVVVTDQTLADRNTVGDAIFYPNGGAEQPSCCTCIFGICLLCKFKLFVLQEFCISFNISSFVFLS